MEARKDREYFRAEQDRAKKEITACEAELKAAGTEAVAVRGLEEKCEALKVNVSEAETELTAAREKLAAASLLAPGSGIVVKVTGNVGDTVEPGQPVMTILDLDRMWVEARVDDADQGSIRLGQPVSLKTEAFPNETFSGKVIGLGIPFSAEESGVPGSRSPGTEVKPGQGIPVKISVDDPQHIPQARNDRDGKVHRQHRERRILKGGAPEAAVYGSPG